LKRSVFAPHHSLPRYVYVYGSGSFEKNQNPYTSKKKVGYGRDYYSVGSFLYTPFHNKLYGIYSL
jgi:hypothetical protein